MLNTKNDVEFFMEAGDQIEKGFGKQSDLYMDLITEECIHELVKEYDRKNLIGIADGIIDTIWVVNGFINTFPNIEKDLVWNNINVECCECSSDEFVNLILKCYVEFRMEYSLQKTIYAKNQNITSNVRMISKLRKLIENVLALGESLNLPLQELWNEVARSNLSKIPEGGKVIKNESGKIQKPDSYFAPDIKKILEHHDIY